MSAAPEAAPVAFLDACVLYPPLVRGLLLGAAAEGLLRPRLSPRVLEEWARATERDHGAEAARAVRAEAAAILARWPEACGRVMTDVTTPDRREADARPTPARHPADARPTPDRRRPDARPTPDRRPDDAPGPPEGAEWALPDPADVHVLEAALAAGASLLVTSNLRDFPAPKLRPLGLAPISPDALLWELAGRAPEGVSRALATALTAFPALAEDRAETVRALKRAHLPRLAKTLRKGGLSP